MAQHDYTIANQSFPNTRSDLNNSLSAIVSNNSGATEPSTTYAYQWWYDETTDILKMRNADNDAWITMFTFNQTADTYSLATDVELTITENLDLTGSATISGDLTVDTDTLYVDSTNNHIGVGTTSPAQIVHINEAITGSVRLRIENSEGFGEFSTDGDAVQLRNQAGVILNSVNAGDTQIRDGSSSVKMTVTSSGTQFNDAIFLGGTGSANELDDYEYGTWTPRYSSPGGDPSSVTYDRQNGYYYKIGGVVHVWWTLRTDAINTTGMSGDFYVSGLPFTVGATVNDSVLAGGDAIVDNFLNDTVLTKTGVLDNAANIAFFVEGSHAGTDATTVLKNAANANSMYGHMTYFVDF